MTDSADQDEQDQLAGHRLHDAMGVRRQSDEEARLTGAWLRSYAFGMAQDIDAAIARDMLETPCDPA